MNLYYEDNCMDDLQCHLTIFYSMCSVKWKHFTHFMNSCFHIHPNQKEKEIKKKTLEELKKYFKKKKNLMVSPICYNAIYKKIKVIKELKEFFIQRKLKEHPDWVSLEFRTF